MNASESTLLQMVSKLPPSEAKEVSDFVEFLIEKKKRERRSGAFLRQDWAGALSQHKSQFTSLELQKKAMEWRNE